MIYVAFHASWSDPPGEVIRTFADKGEAEHFCYEEMSGHGYVVVDVPMPERMNA